MSDIAIRVEGLSKEYHIGGKQAGYRTLRDAVADTALAPFRRFRAALRQPVERKIVNRTRKWLLRQIVRGVLPSAVSEAPKPPVQTPQREWLRGPLRGWAPECIEAALEGHGGSWLDVRSVRAAWREYCEGRGDNSFYVWQWINLAMMTEVATRGANA